jgi:Cu/Ag efflux pump CusA
MTKKFFYTSLYLSRLSHHRLLLSSTEQFYQQEKNNLMLKRFIERPVLSTVVSIILLLLGGLSLYTLPVTLFPDIAPPSVQVSAFYPGANAEVVARSVATPIEEAINGVEKNT